LTRALVVLAHPMAGSLCGHLAARVEAMAQAQGWAVSLRDLSAEGFDPRLTAGERSSYYSRFRSEAEKELEDLSSAEVVILVFPTWWFGFPAVLKGWFDRVWAPGTAFDHSPGYGPMIPRLGGLREVLAVTTMGAPGWVDWLVMRRPLARVLRWGIVRPCAPNARVTWRALYRAEGVEPSRLAAFERRIAAEIAAVARRL
jgi:putative NADPH-quinone reductase